MQTISAISELVPSSVSASRSSSSVSLKQTACYNNWESTNPLTMTVSLNLDLWRKAKQYIYYVKEKVSKNKSISWVGHIRRTLEVTFHSYSENTLKLSVNMYLNQFLLKLKRKLESTNVLICKEEDNHSSCFVSIYIICRFVTNLTSM